MKITSHMGNMSRNIICWSVVLVAICLFACLCVYRIEVDPSVDPSGKSSGRVADVGQVANSAELHSGGSEVIRSSMLVRLHVLDDDGHPVPRAMLAAGVGHLREVESKQAIATSSEDGVIAAQITELPGQGDLVVACRGYQPSSIGASSSVVDGGIVRLRKLRNASIFVHEFHVPLSGAVVCLSSRAFGQDEVSGGGSSAIGLVGGIGVGVTDERGIASVPIPEGARYMMACRAGYLSKGGGLIIVEAGIPNEIEMRRVIGCFGKVLDDEILAYCAKIPAFLNHGPENAADLQRLVRELRGPDRSGVAFLGLSESPVLAEGQSMEVCLLTAHRGLVGARLRIRGCDSKMEPEVIQSTGLSIGAPCEVVFSASVNGRRIASPPPLQVTIRVESEGAVSKGAELSMLIDWDRPMRLPPGNAIVGHRSFRVLESCVLPGSKSWIVPSVGPAAMNVELSAVPCAVVLNVVDQDGLRVRGANVRMARSGAAPGDQPVVHVFPDAWNATVWVPPGEWDVVIRPFDREGRVGVKRLVIPDAGRADSILLR